MTTAHVNVSKAHREIIEAWRAKRLADLEGRTASSLSLEKRINALLDCLPRR